MNVLERDKIAQAGRLHDLAMNAAEAAAIARLHGEAGYSELFRQAFKWERDAANALAMEYAFEPSRAILHRSAAALALECGEWRAAEQLIGAALAGDPPEDIAEELRGLLQQVYSVRVHAVA